MRWTMCCAPRPACWRLEIEWNNKDPFFDRDLENFQRLHALGAISLGVLVTRGASLQAALPGIVRGALEGRRDRGRRGAGRLGGQDPHRAPARQGRGGARARAGLCRGLRRQLRRRQVRPGDDALGQAHRAGAARGRQSLSASADRAAGERGRGRGAAGGRGLDAAVGGEAPHPPLGTGRPAPGRARPAPWAGALQRQPPKAVIRGCEINC